MSAPRHTFAVWRILESGQHYPLHISATTLGDIVAEAADQCGHKQQFLIRQTDSVTGAIVLRIHQIKQGKEVWLNVPGVAHAIKSYRKNPALICTMLVESFEPAEPWKWTPGADVVGVDRTIVEARSHA